MRNAILLHGKPGKEEYYDASTPSCSNYHWFPWLQKQLLVKNIKADTPEVPLAYEPKYELWVKEVERFEITPETILVGHSCGGGFWVRYLSEHKDLYIGKVVLVAPSLGTGWDNNGFFDFTIDPGVAKRVKSITIFVADNEKQKIKDSVEKISSLVPDIKLVELNGMGHFTQEDMVGSEFPELLEEILA